MKRHHRTRPQLSLLALAVVALFSQAAAAEGEPHDWELAIQANEVNEQYCAEIYGGSVNMAAEGYQEVASVWAALDDGFERSRNPELQYWRGVLAQCLGQEDRAEVDLTAFLGSLTKERRSALQAMVKDASRRLRRIERARSSGARFDSGHERSSGTFGLALSGGPAYGPLFSVHHEVQTEGSDVRHLTDSLLPAWGLHLALGPEIVIAPPLVWALQAGAVVGYRQHTIVAAEGMESLATAVVDDIMEPRACLMLQARTGLGLLLAPQHKISPVARVSLLYRMMPAWDYSSDHEPLAAWHVVSLGGFAGVVLDVTPHLGFEAGCWISGDLTATQRLFASDGGSIDEATEEALEPVVVSGRRLSVWPTASVRILFGGGAEE